MRKLLNYFITSPQGNQGLTSTTFTSVHFIHSPSSTSPHPLHFSLHFISLESLPQIEFIPSFCIHESLRNLPPHFHFPSSTHAFTFTSLHFTSLHFTSLQPLPQIQFLYDNVLTKLYATRLSIFTSTHFIHSSAHQFSFHLSN